MGEEGEFEQDSAGESQEDEMLFDEEGEEEGDEELVSDGGEDAPELVPIQKNTINHEHRESSSEVSDINVDDYGSSSDGYDTDELNVDTTANPHGFVYANMLETFSKSRTDRIAEMRENFDRDAHRKKFQKKKNSKAIGKTEKVHAKNKPLMMVKKKKINQAREQMTVLNQHKDRTRTFLGHFRKSTQQKITSKKMAKVKGRVRV